ncbi:MAG: hemerythrin domain-containing protein [Melioribacteraceae bacterium]|nr:hemerythrin domain-containing protein [Melioribacteraceae bacterium]
MKRHNALIPLSHDHHHGLLLSQLLKKDAPKYKGLPDSTQGKIDYLDNAYKTELIPHFKNEEEILFPFVRGKDANLDALIDEVLEQHIRIEQLYAQVKTSGDKILAMNDFALLLDQHIRLEEREVFPLIQELFDDQLEELNGKIVAVKSDDGCET